MKRVGIIAAFVALLPLVSAEAQGPILPGPGLPAASAAYAGPGDVYGAAIAWWGLRAFSAADKGNRLINICDPSNVTCADWSSSATTGKLIVGTNPLNGTDCTVSTSCQIATMYDRSGSTNCTGTTACDVKQSTAANRPTFNWNSGSPFLVCSGTQALTTFSAASIITQAVPHSVSWVAMRTSGAALAAAFATGNRRVAVGYTASANTLDMFAGGDAGYSGTDNAYHASQNVFATVGTNSTFFIDGTGPTTVGTSSGTASITTGDFFNICNDDGNAVPLTGRIREGGYWAGAFSSGNQATVNTQQHSVWGF